MVGEALRLGDLDILEGSRTIDPTPEGYLPERRRRWGEGDLELPSEPLSLLLEPPSTRIIVGSAGRGGAITIGTWGGWGPGTYMTEPLSEPLSEDLGEGINGWTSS